ncbi:hypothetical protein TTHERM_00047620 (macronuclear) [Tetrahymena thermophila SB210]|uniref:Uncharacterized protein n=1 Tax=Tetrahymena thermophila (strain SB210) TaxID=312017 RepID=Q23DC9_TETTS|nr:hypothetical protein TTHERM_00047620 [Tetrahymena thermophila SB210]EAR94601.2 hypothetical protein TTHERM_00047620 [Tetrahymena thermophila SB210]|eukprot:XP_001014757.2 hypothetical protein TTHERM_00047620 [Tetrahymena thermophila SB210]
MNRFNEDVEDHQNIEFDENSDQKSFQFYDGVNQNFNLVDESDLQLQDDIIHLNEQHLKDKEKQNFETKNKCQENCVYNRKHLQKLVEESLKEKYERYFFFYFAKPINEILSNSPVHHVVLFKEYLFIDDNTEYAKRFYFEHETKQRIEQLANFYKKVYPPIRPNYFGCLKAFNDIIQQNKYNLDELYYKQVKNKQVSSSDCNNFKQDELHLENNGSIYGYQLDIQSDSNFTESQLHKENINQSSSNNLNSFQNEQCDNIQNEQGQNKIQSQIKTNQQQKNNERNQINLNQQRNNFQMLSLPKKLHQENQNDSLIDQSNQSLSSNLVQLEEEDAKTDNQVKGKNYQGIPQIDQKEQQCFINNYNTESYKKMKNESPDDRVKFNQLNQIQFSGQCQVRELANSQNKKESNQHQDKKIDNKNRANYNYFKNNENIPTHQQNIQKTEEEKDNIQFNNSHSQCDEQDDFEDMLNILHSQNLKKFENIQNIEFEGQNDFSLHSNEFMDQDNFGFGNQSDGIYCDNQKFYQKYLDKQNDNLQTQNDQLFAQENYEHEQREQFYQDLKQIDKSSQQSQSDIEQQDNDEDYLSSQRSEEDQNHNNIFGENSFMKQLNEYEIENSFETDTFDVYNPQFSSDQRQKSPSYQLQQEEKNLFKQVSDLQDIDDLMERYAIGEEGQEFVCRCAEFAQNKQNNSNKLFEEQEKGYFQRIENTKEQRNFLKQDCNSHRSKNSDNSNINLQQLVGQIDNGQIKKAASTSLSKLKNHSSTPSNQNNNPSCSSMKSSQHQQQLQPEDYQFQLLQQSLQQQIQQQQTYIQQNNGQQKQKSPVKKQQFSEQQKQITDSSPAEKLYEKDYVQLSPILAQKSQNFNEMLQVQIQNQMMIKQKLEKQKGDNLNNKIIEQNQQYFSNYDLKIDANSQYKQNQLLQQSQTSKLLINQLQQSYSNKNIQNPNVSLTNSKNMNSNNISNSNNNNNSKIDQNSQIYQSNMQFQQQQTKPFYNNTQKKLASQLVFQNNLLNQQNQSSNQQQKFFKQNNELSMNSNQQQNASLQQGINSQGIDSSPSIVASIIKQGQKSNEAGNTKKSQKKLNQNEQQNQSCQNNFQQSSKTKINSNNQPQNNFHISPLQSLHQISGASNSQQQVINQSKNNLQNKSNNFSQHNIKNNLSKGHNPSPQQQLNILALNQQNFNEKSQSYKAYNQISSQYSNNQSKLDLKNTTSSLIASATPSQKGLSNQYQNQLVTSQPNPSSSSKSRAKMHGKEQRNINQNNHGSCSLSNIKKQNASNQLECQTLCLQTNSLTKSHHIPSQTEQFQQDNVQQFQSPSDLNNLTHSKNNPSNQMAGEKKNNEQSLIIFGSQHQKIEQQHYQYTSPPQKRQYDNKSMSLLGANNKQINKSISHSTNFFQKDEGGVRNSQAQQSTIKMRDSSKKNSDIMQVIGSTIANESNQNIALIKQASKENITQKSDQNNKIQNSILASNQNNKLRALNIEVQRRISLKHQIIKENNLFIGTHKNVSIDRDSIPSTSQDGQIQSRFDQFNISRKQNSMKMNQKRFPHLNNSVGDPSSIDKKQDISNVVSILDSNREMQYSNNPHHNQIVQQLLALNQINPPIADQGFKKSSQNFLHAASKNSNQNIIESATKLAANVYSQSSHKNIKNIQNHIINSGSSQVANQYNYSRSFVQTTNNNPTTNLNQCLTSQQNSRINSQEKVFSRLNKNKSLDENLKKKNSQSNILNQSNAQQIDSNSTAQRQQQFNSLSNSLPNKKLKQHYYPLSNTTSQYQGHAQAASHPIFMSPQFKNQNNTFQNSDQFQLDNSNAFNRAATQNTAQTVSYCNQKQNQQLFDTDSTQISQMTLQHKNRTKQNIIPFNSQISSSLQQSLQSSYQFKQTAQNSQNQFDEILMIDNPISSPRFKKIKSIDKIFNQHEQLQQNINENVSPSKSSTPSQSNTSNQQYIATFSNLNEKEKQSSGNKNNIKQSQKKQHFHYNNTANLNLKKNNFLKQQEALRNSQQQQFSIGDGLSQNSSYGFLTSRSMKKSLKEGQASQKIQVQESPYNMDNIKETSKSLQQQQQQPQLNYILNNQNNFKQNNNNLIKAKQYQYNQKQLLNQIENYEDGQASSRQESINNIIEPNKFFTQNVQGNTEFRNQDQEYGQLLIQQQVQQQQQNQNSNQVIINLQIQQYPSAYISQSQFQGSQMNVRNQQQMSILNQNIDFNQHNTHPNQYQQQISENYSKIKNDLKQNALDIIKTQKRKK